MSPMRLLLILFLLLPVIEIYVLIKVGGLIGALPVVLLVIMAALLGVALLRLQGVATLARAQKSLARGELPAVAMLEGAVSIIGALLLIIPGFFTDAIALFCLAPPLRHLLVLWVVRRGVIFAKGKTGSASRPEQKRRTLEGEYWKDDEKRK